MKLLTYLSLTLLLSLPRVLHADDAVPTIENLQKHVASNNASDTHEVTIESARAQLAQAQEQNRLLKEENNKLKQASRVASQSPSQQKNSFRLMIDDYVDEEDAGIVLVDFIAEMAINQLAARVSDDHIKQVAVWLQNFHTENINPAEDVRQTLSSKDLLRKALLKRLEDKVKGKAAHAVIYMLSAGVHLLSIGERLVIIGASKANQAINNWLDELEGNQPESLNEQILEEQCE